MEKDLKNVIVESARSYFKESNMYIMDAQGNIEIEVYTDYSDKVDDTTIKNAFELFEGNIEKVRDYLYQHIWECYTDTICDMEFEVCEEVGSYLRKNLDKETLEELESEWLLETSEIREILMNHSVVSVNVDYNDILERSNIDLIISLENPVSVDHEFTLSNFNGNVLEWIEETQEAIDDGDFSENDISIITLLKSQGYTFEAFKQEATDYFTKDHYKPSSKFMESLLDECYNATSTCNALVFLKTLNLKEYLEGETVKTIEKGFAGGYVDFVYGGGSTVNLSLAKDIPLHNIQHEKFVDGIKYGFSFKEIYGEFIQ